MLDHLSLASFILISFLLFLISLFLNLRKNCSTWNNLSNNKQFMNNIYIKCKTMSQIYHKKVLAFLVDFWYNNGIKRGMVLT